MENPFLDFSFFTQGLICVISRNSPILYFTKEVHPRARLKWTSVQIKTGADQPQRSSCLAFCIKNIREHSFYSSNFALFKKWFIFSVILYTFNNSEISLPICERLSIFFEKFIIYWPTASLLAGVVLVLDWLYRTTNSSCSRFLLCRLYKNG